MDLSETNEIEKFAVLWIDGGYKFSLVLIKFSNLNIDKNNLLNFTVNNGQY